LRNSNSKGHPYLQTLSYDSYLVTCKPETAETLRKQTSIRFIRIHTGNEKI